MPVVRTTAQPTTFTTTLTPEPDGAAVLAIYLPFDPKARFGKARAPVNVTLCGYTYRTTTFTMGTHPDGSPCRFVPFRKSHQQASGVKPGQRVDVTMSLDEAPRVVEVPADLARALEAAGAQAIRGFKAFSHSHQREYVEAITEAKRPETRAKRVSLAVSAAVKKSSATKASKRASSTGATGAIGASRGRTTKVRGVSRTNKPRTGRGSR